MMMMNRFILQRPITKWLLASYFLILYHAVASMQLVLSGTEVLDDDLCPNEGPKWPLAVTYTSSHASDSVETPRTWNRRQTRRPFREATAADEATLFSSLQISRLKRWFLLSRFSLVPHLHLRGAPPSSSPVHVYLVGFFQSQSPSWLTYWLIYFLKTHYTCVLLYSTFLSFYYIVYN